MGDISIIQALLVFVVAFIMGIDQFSFLESLYQPIVTCPIIGAILGNFELGIVVGGAYQLIQIGSMRSVEHSRQTQFLVVLWQLFSQFHLTWKLQQTV